jgi:protein-disulfide isomerase
MPRARLFWTAIGLVLVIAGVIAFQSRRGAVAAQLTRPPQGPPLLPAAVIAPRQQDPLLAQRTKGSATAPLTVYELSDFQCPYCRHQALEVLPALEKEFIATGKLRWIFINFPLTQIHPNSSAASEFAMCAAKVDKFWPVHDLLFTYQEKWAPLKDPGPFLITLADSVGIPRDDLTPCLQNHEMLGLIQGEAEGAAKSGVSSTPTVYIEGVGLLRGAAPLEIYRQVLDSLWRDKTAGK